MKYTAILALLLASLAGNAQHKIDHYTASNGVTYKPGDTVQLGMGSAPDGSFRFLRIGGWALFASSDMQDRGVGRNYDNLNVVVKHIVTTKFKGAQIYKLIVGGGNITNYDLFIEEAIATCEVKACKPQNQPAVSAQIDVADELTKLGKLLKDSLITRDEYEAQKKKLLTK